MKASLSPLLAALVTSAAHGGAVLCVDDDAPPGGDGQTWATAFRHLRDALAAAGDPRSGIGEIRVAQGLYRPDRDAANPAGTGDRTASFPLIDGVSLLGGFAGLSGPDPDARNVQGQTTILSGDLAGDDASGGSTAENSHHVVVGDGTDGTAVLDGFTVTGGHADATSSRHGAGLTVSNGGPTVRHCRFVENHATADFGAGGAVYCSGGAGTLTLEDCDFEDNSALFGAVGSETSFGGAVYCDTAGLISGCAFQGNDSERGGAVYVAGSVTVEDSAFIGNSASRGGGLFRTGNSGSLLVTGCTFQENQATVGGGAELFTSQGGPTFVSCRFVGNSAVIGGGLHGLADTAVVANGLFCANVASSCAGAIGVAGPGAWLVNCTIGQNTAGQGGGVCATSSLGEPALTSCVLWGNTDGGGSDETAQIDWIFSGAPLPAVDYCDVQGFTGVLGGIANGGADPMYVDPLGADGVEGTGDEDLRLSPGSPCIHAGDTASLPPDLADLDGDGDTAEPLPMDLDGNARVVGAAVDIGAGEFAGCTDAPEDVTINGFIDGDDIVDVIASWGACPGCLADVNGDGVVDGIDLVAIILRWGQCG